MWIRREGQAGESSYIPPSICLSSHRLSVRPFLLRSTELNTFMFKRVQRVPSQDSEQKDSINVKGCVPQFEKWLQDNLTLVAGIFIGVALLQVPTPALSL